MKVLFNENKDYTKAKKCLDKVKEEIATINYHYVPLYRTNSLMKLAKSKVNEGH